MANTIKRSKRSSYDLELPKVEVSFNNESNLASTSPTTTPAAPLRSDAPTPAPAQEIVREVTRVVHEAERRRLPSERQAIVHKFAIDNEEGFMTVGLFEDGTPGEIFIRLAKSDATISGLCDAIAITLSLGLQYGVPLEVYVAKFINQSFAPQGFTPNPNIPEVESILDYLGRWLAYHFLSDDALVRVGLESLASISNEQLAFNEPAQETADDEPT